MQYLKVSFISFFAPLMAFSVIQPGQSGGTLALSELDTLISQSETLNQDISRMLKQTNQTRDSIVCIGVRLGRHFGPLGAARVAPFECKFTDTRFLVIEAENRIKLPNGRVVNAEKLADQLTETRPLAEGSTLEMRLRSWQWKQVPE